MATSSPETIKRAAAKSPSVSGNLRWAVILMFVIGTAALLEFSWAGGSNLQAVTTVPVEVLATRDRSLHKEKRDKVTTAEEDSEDDSEEYSLPEDFEPEDSEPEDSKEDQSVEDGSEDSQQDVRPAQKGWMFADEKFTGIIHPRDVFLWYTKGEKTSSTVAATIMAAAYEEAGLAVVTQRFQLLGAAPGAYASLHHEPYSDDQLRKLRDVVQKPVLVVVSIREGSDWVMSQGFRAERLKRRGNGMESVTACSSIEENLTKATCRRYSKYLPPAESDTLAWWVIRHENVVEDTCAMLAKLGLNCPKDKAIGQQSRSSVEDLVECPIPKKPGVVKCINAINEDVFNRKVIH